jgi:hypothetical protein
MRAIVTFVSYAARWFAVDDDFAVTTWHLECSFHYELFAQFVRLHFESLIILFVDVLPCLHERYPAMITLQ